MKFNYYFSCCWIPWVNLECLDFYAQILTSKTSPQREMKENLLQLLSSRSTFVGDSSMWSKCTFCYLDLFIICKFIFAQAISGSATWGHMDVIALFFWEEWISSLSEKVLNLVESFQVDFITSMTSVNVHTYGYYSETFESLSMNTWQMMGWCIGWFIIYWMYLDMNLTHHERTILINNSV